MQKRKKQGMVAIEQRDPSSLVQIGRRVTVASLREIEDRLEIEHVLDDNHRFTTRIIYPQGDLARLRDMIGQPACHVLFCHIALAESLKFTVTFPHTLDVTAIAAGLTVAAADFVRDVASRAWGQHMLENGVAHYRGPRIVAQPALPASQAPLTPLGVGPATQGTPQVFLCANGGGKDSFLVLKTLERAGLPTAVFQHARSEYGPLDKQHALQRRPLKHVSGVQRVHELSVCDDVTDGARIRQLNPQLRGECVAGRPCQVGWPEMVIEALPFVLLHGYRGLVLGNERSADAAQACWPALDHLGGQVNHQWLKSYDAECRLRAFLRDLCPAVEVFSLLKPIHDYRIYKLLSAYPDVLPDIHSCNVAKPWCWRCLKCLYVWANLVARFGLDMVAARCGCPENLFDVAALQPLWARLLGRDPHMPAWECVGERVETVAALQQCAARGMRGQALAASPWSLPSDFATTYDRVHATGHNIPSDVWGAVEHFL